MDAVEEALVIDPSYNTTSVLGPLEFTPVNVSDPQESATPGSAVVLNSEYSCSDPTATISYQWSFNGSDIPGSTESSLSLDNASEAYAGTYECVVSAANSLNQNGSVTTGITLTVNPAPEPSGVINTGRSGDGPQDLAPSYFASLSNMPAGVTEPQLELYIPGTDTVIPYNAELPLPYRFDSMGNCFNVGDYRTVIRVAATGDVLATVYPPEGANKDIFWLYNPVVPS
jgi:hypothetical protein